MNELNSRLTLWQSYGALRAATRNPLATERTELGRLFRKGMIVAAFNILEGFILERWEEVTISLESNRQKVLTFSDLPNEKKLSILKHHMQLLTSNVPIFDDRLQEFLATSEVLDPKTNRLFPKSTFMPQGSNISEGSLTSAFELCAIKSPWQQMNSVLRFTFQHARHVDAKKRFETFLNLRNKCAHNSSAPAEVGLFRSIPTLLISLSFSFDILISMFGKHLLDATHVSELHIDRTERLVASNSWIRADVQLPRGTVDLYSLSCSSKSPDSSNQIGTIQIKTFEDNREITLFDIYSDETELLAQLIKKAEKHNASYVTLVNKDSSELLGWSSVVV